MSLLDELMQQYWPHLIKQESGGNPFAVSPKGAFGKAQLMPETAADPGYGVAGAKWQGGTYDPSNPADVAENERVGKDYFGAMLARYGDPSVALAAYNAGPGRADKYGKSLHKYPRETQNYVKSILTNAKTPARANFDRLTQPMSVGLRPDMTAGLDVSQGAQTGGMAPIQDEFLPSMMPQPTQQKLQPNTGGMNPIQDPSIKAMFMSGQQPSVGMQAPSALTLGEGVTQGDHDTNLPPDPDEPPANTSQPKGWLDNFRAAGGPAALTRFGAGLAANASKGWGAGIGAGLAGAQDALDDRMSSREKFLTLLMQKQYRDEMLKLSQERNDIARGQNKNAVTEIYVDGKPHKAIVDPNDPNNPKLVGGPKSQQTSITNTDKEQIIAADESTRAGNGALVNLNHALDINDKSYGGFPGASTLGYITSAFGNDRGEATEDLSNTIMGNALAQLKTVFGGNPTEGERAILIDIQGSVGKTAKVRKQIFDRAKAAVEARIKYNKEQADAIRSGRYYTPGGAPDMLDAAPPPPPPPPPTQEELRLLQEEDPDLWMN